MRLTLSQDQRPGTTADVPDNVGFLRVIFHEESFENEGPNRIGIMRVFCKKSRTRKYRAIANFDAF